MRLLTLTVALTFLTAAAAYPPPPRTASATGPAVTFQTASIGRLVDDVKALVRSVAGPLADQALQEMDKSLDQTFGNFDGLDTKKSLAGYVTLKDRPEETGAVLVVPYTDEAKFVATIGKGKPKATAVPGNKGLYKFEAEGDPSPFPIRIRFHDGYAYVGLNLPDKDLDVVSLIPVEKLNDPKETAQFAAKGSMDKVPAALVQILQKQLNDGLNDMKKGAESGGPNAVKAAGAFDSLVRRQTTAVIRDGDRLGFKARLDSKTGALSLDSILTGKAGSVLAADIAAWAKPKTNRFAGLVAAKDAVGTVLVKLPLSVPELRVAAEAGLAQLETTAKDQLPEVAHPLLTELMGGLNRTAKSGDADLAAVFRGPDAAGTFTGVAAVSFADATKAETELKALVKAIGPKDVKDAIRWDVAKAGNVNLHEMKIAGYLPPEAKKVFGDKAVLVLGFGKDAVYAGIGPDARAQVTAAASLKPAGAATGPTVLFDTSYNPARVMKLVNAINEQVGASMLTFLGTGDAAVPLFHLSVSGGSQLTVTQTISLKLYGGGFLFAFRAGRQP